MGLKLRFGIAFSAEMVPKGVIDLSNPNGFGKLVLVHHKQRKGINPRNKTSIDIPAKVVVKFRVSKVAKDAILSHLS